MKRALALVAFGLALAACGSTCGDRAEGGGDRDGASPASSYVSGGAQVPLPPNALAVPLVRQQAGYSCGDAAALALLRYVDPAHYAATAETALYAPLGTTPNDGTEPQAIAKYLAHVPGLSAELRTHAMFTELVASVLRGDPVIVDLEAWQAVATEAQMKPWRDDWDDGHYAVLVGYDEHAWFFMDPSTDGAYAYVPRDELEARWHDTLRTGEKIAHWAIFVHAEGDAGVARVTPNGRARRMY